jgi:hypothetical protein
MAKSKSYKYRVKTVGGFELTQPGPQPSQPPLPIQPSQPPLPTQPSQQPVVEQKLDANGLPVKKPWWKFWAGKRSSKRTMKKRCYKNKTTKKGGKSRRSRK